MKILKFGGSSVATPERIKAVIDIIQSSKSEESIAVVFSAFGGVTDALISLSQLALSVILNTNQSWRNLKSDTLIRCVN